MASSLLVGVAVAIPVSMAAHAVWRFVEDQRLGKPSPVQPQLVGPGVPTRPIDPEPELAPTLFDPPDDEAAAAARRVLGMEGRA